MKTRFLAVFLLMLAVMRGAGASQPNFLVILVDDMGYSDIGCFGGEIRTPNIDRLADNGMRFTQMYNTAKCFPTRAALLTGIYFQHTDREFPHTATVGEVLRPAGYRTLWSGKHHAKFNPITRGFDRFSGMLGGAGNHFNPGLEAIPGQPAPANKGTNAWAIDEVETSPYVPDDPKFYTTDTFTDYALDWLEEYKDEDKPFFLYVAYTAPHWPLHAWPEDIAKYEGVYDAGYESVRNARYARQVEMGLMDPSVAPLSEPEWGKVWSELTDDEKKEEAMLMAVYAAMVDRVDQNVGRLVQKLDRLGELDNTLILFLSDNGASPETPEPKVSYPDAPIGSVGSFPTYGKSWSTVSETPLRKRKGSSFEGGNCTPMIAHWPDVIKGDGRFYREPAHLIDILATIVDVTGAAYPGESKEPDIPALEGVSLMPVFKGGAHKRNDPLYWQWGSGSATRRGNWKLVRGRNEWELYNMDADRTETINLAPEFPERVKHMGNDWNSWYKACTGTEYTRKKRKRSGR